MTRNPLTITIITLFLYSINSFSQEKLTLEQCYSLASKNHPIAGKTQILQQQNDLELQALQAQKYPRIDAETQATYQSDVMVLPITLPNFHIDSPDKDQYKITLTANQLLYNGGQIDSQKELKKIQSETQQKEVEVQLHTVKSQINQLYFNILLMQQKIELLSNSIAQLQSKKAEIQKMIANGSTYESATEPVEVKILELSQNVVELQAQKVQFYDQLGLIIGQRLNANTFLTLPVSSDFNEKKRSELALFELQKNAVDTQSELLKKQTLPKVIAFGTAGYGKPGLNALSNEFEDFYMIGVKAQWNVFDFQANKKQRQALTLQKDLIENQEQVFEWQQTNTTENFKMEIVKYQTLLKTDQEIINYRKKIMETAGKQLKHDLITTSDYTAEINKLVEAQINQKSHEIALQLAQTNLNTTLYE